MTSKQQKAVFVNELGKPVELGKRNIATPGEGQVLVKITSTMLLPHDAYGRDKGLFIGKKLPYILGSNVAGTVEPTHSSVSHLFPSGERVFGLSSLVSEQPDQAGLQEYALLNADAVAKTPESLTDDEVVSLPINLVTSFIALFTELGFDFPAPWQKSDFDFASQTLLFVGAGSAAAKFALQLGKIVGIGKMIAIANLSNTSTLKVMGATHVIDRHASHSSIKDQVFAANDGKLVTHIYDCYSSTYELATSLLSGSGPSHLVTLRPINAATVQAERPQCVVKHPICSNEHLAPHTEEFWKRLGGWLEKGEIQPTPHKVIGSLENVDEINAALDDYAAGKGGPQPVVHP